MKRGITILLSLSVLDTGAYFIASKWAIRHETISFYDPDRNNRLVAVDITVRLDKEIQDLSIFESGAILLHLGERSDALAYADQMAHFAAADAA